MRRLIKFLLVTFVVLGIFSCVVVTLFDRPTSKSVEQFTPTAQPVVITQTPQPPATQTQPPQENTTPIPTNTAAPTATPVGYISRNMVGEKWPIKDVDAGIVRCTRLTGGVQVITFEANGKTYAVNGSAKSRIDSFGWEDVETIQNRELTATGLLKYPITPILDAGLALCR